MSNSNPLFIDGVISVKGTKGEDFRDTLSMEEILTLNKIICKLNSKGVEIQVDYTPLKKPLIL